MYYLVYKLENIINGKYYIGAHKTDKIDDDYFGSGVIINKAIKKYGKFNFIKTILYNCLSEEEMYNKEKEVISELWSEDNNCYNCMPGGIGGFQHINITKMHNGKNNPMHNPVIKEKVIRKSQETKNKNKKKYDILSTKNLEITWKNNKGKKRPEHSEWMKNQNKEFYNNKNRIEKLINSKCKTYELINPNGDIIITNRLEEYSIKNNLGLMSLYNSARNNGILIKKGLSKGWICKLI